MENLPRNNFNTWLAGFPERLHKPIIFTSFLILSLIILHILPIHANFSGETKIWQNSIFNSHSAVKASKMENSLINFSRALPRKILFSSLIPSGQEYLSSFFGWLSFVGNFFFLINGSNDIDFCNGSVPATLHRPMEVMVLPRSSDSAVDSFELFLMSPHGVEV